MRILKPLILALFGLLASVGLAQIPAPQINLSGNIGCQGFPCFNVGTLVLSVDANHSMTAQESSAQSPSLMTVTSSVSLTATRNLITPAGRFSFTIENATTGGQSIQIIGPSGTGVTIANGTTVSVGNDGTNFVQIGASGSGGGASFPSSGLPCIPYASSTTASTCLTSAELQTSGAVVLAPTASQTIVPPANTWFNPTAENVSFDPTVLNSTSVTPSGSLSPNSVAVSWPYEFVTVQGTAPSQINTYNISTGVQVAVGSPTTFSGCAFINGVATTNLSGTKILVATCNDNGTLYTFSINSAGALTPIGSVTGLTAASPGSVIHGAFVYVPLFGVATSTTGAVAKVSISATVAPAIVTTTTLATPSSGPQNPFSIAYSGGFLFVEAGHEPPATNDSTIQVLNATTMALVGSPFVVAHSPQKVFAQGHVLYVSFFDAQQVQSIDISNPASLVSLQILSLGSCNAIPLQAIANDLYVGCFGGNKILLVDASSPSNMRIVQTYTGFTSPESFAATGRFLAVVTGASGGSVYLADAGGIYAQRLTATNEYAKYFAAHIADIDSLNVRDTITSVGPGVFGAGTTVGGVPAVVSASPLTNNALVVGVGGQNVASFAMGTNLMVLHGNAGGLPSWSSVNLMVDVTSILPPGFGGTGVGNTATHTLGTSNQNWATLGTGIVKNTTTTGAISDAASTDVISLWTGSCTSSTFLRGDGSCATATGSTGISGGVANFVPLFGSATTITGPSHIDDGSTTASTVTISEPVNIVNSVCPTCPGSVSWGAGSGGSLPALLANSFGFAAPVTGGTSYLIKAPATITAGIAHFAAPATADGVNESALTSSAVNLATADVTGLLPVANGGTGTSTPGIVAGTNVTVTGTWPNQTVNATGGSSSAFSALTAGTNTTAAMVVGTGASLAISGSGTIAATTTNAIAGNVTFSTGLSTTGAGTIASPYVVTTTGAGATTLASVASGIAPSSSGSYDFNNNDIINNALGTAISSANFSSSNHIFRGSFWTGTVAAADGYTIFNQITTAGANPPTRLIISHAGSTGLAQVQVPDLIDVALGSSTSPVCPNGTNNALTTSGCAGGSTTWNGIANPTGNQALTMGNNTTTWTFGAATGATTPMVSITDTASNTGTGAVLKLNTAASSNAFPMQLFQRGTALLTVGATAGGTGSGFAGTLFVNATSNAQFTGLYVGGSGAYVIGTSFFTAGSGGSVGNGAVVGNAGQTTGTGAQLTFDGQNTGFALTPIAGISGVMTAPAGSTLTGDMVFCVSNASTCTERMRLKAAGDLDVTQIVGNSSTPTMVAGVAAGAAPSCTTVVGTNLSGVLTCTTGTAPATGILATVTFAGTLPVAPQGCALMPRNALTAATTNNIFTSAPSTTTWTINVVVALTLSTAYSWSYSCI